MKNFAPWVNLRGDLSPEVSIHVRPTLVLFLLSATVAVSAPRPVTGSLESFVVEMRTFLPQEGSSGYVVPTTAERLAFATAVAAALSGNEAKVELALAPYPDFEVLDFTDDKSGRYLAIVEKPPLHRGWGFIFVARHPARPELLVEVPHPLADRDSEVVGARAARALSPKAFIMAGAHRFALPGRLSDVAHTSASIFESAHEALAAEGLVVLQFHGFGLSLHPDYPDLILSNATPMPDERGARICGAAVDAGIDCRTFDGSAYTDLGAQTNVQAGFLRRTYQGASFLHFETGDRVRESDARIDGLMGSLTAEWPRHAQGCGCMGADVGPVAWALLALFNRRNRTRSSC